MYVCTRGQSTWMFLPFLLTLASVSNDCLILYYFIFCSLAILISSSYSLPIWNAFVLAVSLIIVGIMWIQLGLGMSKSKAELLNQKFNKDFLGEIITFRWWISQSRNKVDCFLPTSHQFAYYSQQIQWHIIKQHILSACQLKMIYSKW